MNLLRNKIVVKKKYTNYGFFGDSVLGDRRMQQGIKGSRTTEKSGYKTTLAPFCCHITSTERYHKGGS